MLPCLIFEDEDLLVVNKPAGMNTHAPSPYAGEGLYDWLRHRERRWAKLAIMHRLDKETSGIMVFSKTAEANRALAKQFEERSVRKKYVFLTEGRKGQREFTVRGCLVRAGDKYVNRPVHAGGVVAETKFRLLEDKANRLNELHGLQKLNELNTLNKLNEARAQWEAEPLTGRTHQIRVQAAESGIPIMGDVLYGGRKGRRVFLHAVEMTLRHPRTMEEMIFRAEAEFGSDPRWELRKALIDFERNDAYRVIHGASDGRAGWYVDRLGKFLLSQGEAGLDVEHRKELVSMGEIGKCRGMYHKTLARKVGSKGKAEAAPELIYGEAAPERFVVMENGLRFELSFREGYSMGIFLDQRDNRRRVLNGYIGAEFPLWAERFAVVESAPSRESSLLSPALSSKGGEGVADTDSSAGLLNRVWMGKRPEVLNAFAYTCAFSVCAAKAGARVTSVDLSKKYLEWGKRNFELNEIEPAEHDFIFGDVFDWLPRLAKKGRRFDVVLLDPPTFSQSKKFGVFKAEKDYGKLVELAVRVLKLNGVLLCSSNAARWQPESFLLAVKGGIHKAQRRIAQEKYFPQPPDFPISREEPGYLKTVWMRLSE